MDLKSLIAKMDQIEKKQILQESAETVSKEKIAQEEIETESQDFKSSIAQALLKEFDLEEGPLDSIKAWNQKNADALAAKEKAEADMANPANIEAFKKTLTPSQLKWVGNADLSDPIIRSRIPKPQPGEKPAAPATPQATDQRVSPDSQQGQMLAKQTAGMDDPQSGVAGVQGGSEQDRQLAAQTAGMDDKPAATQTAQTPAATGAKGSKPVAATASSQEKMDRFVYLMKKKKEGGAQPAATKVATSGKAINPETGDEYTPVAEQNAAKVESISYLISKLKQLEEAVIIEALTPEEEKELQDLGKEVAATAQSGAEGIPPEVSQAVKDFQASSPAAKAATPSVDPEKLKAYQTKLGVTADGKMGPETAAAVKKFQQDNNLKVDGIIGPQTIAALDKSAPGVATGVNAQGQNVTMPDGTNPETGEKTAATKFASQADVRKADNQIAAQQAATKTAAGATPASTSRTASATLIANEPVIPGKPLSPRQMAVMQMAIASGNKYSPEIMAQYNKQKGA